MVPITFTTAQTEVKDERLNTTHYLIKVKDKKDVIPYKCNQFQDWNEPFILDPTKARTRRFFLISHETTELARVGFKLVHYRRTTFVITLSLAEKVIVPGLPYELVYDYLEQIDFETYLSERRCKFLKK